MKKTLLIAIVLLFAPGAFAQEVQDHPLITVSGSGEVLVVPDEVAFNLRVVSLDKDLLKAQAKNDEVVTKLLALARSYQVRPEQYKRTTSTLTRDIQTRKRRRSPRFFLAIL
jgi:uncharacterized protein YggE